MSKKAIVLISGGIDSTTCLAIARSQNFDCFTLSFDYGQRHKSELGAAEYISRQLGATEHRLLKLPTLNGSALTNKVLELPDYSGSHEIPITYVPARNTIFLSLALGWAEVLEACDIFIGVSSIDYSHYPDCRPEYIECFQKLMTLATKTGVEGKTLKLHTPLVTLSKADTIRKGLELGVDYSVTISCYRADDEGKACGLCDSCAFRKKGFNEAGINDPTRYVI